MTVPHQAAGPGEAQSPLLAERLAQYGHALSRNERLIAQYLVTLPPSDLPFTNAGALARATGTSDASVTRTARRLGFSGLPELKRLASRPRAVAAPPAERLARRLAELDHEGAAATEVFTAAHEMLTEAEGLLDPDSLGAAAGTVLRADTVWCLGMGSSGAVALHLSDLLSRLGTRTRWSRAGGFDLANELVNLREGDALVLVHSSRPLADVQALLDLAGERGVPVVLICGAQLAERYADRATAVLCTVGSASQQASWNVGAFVLTEVLALAVAAGADDTALESRRVLTGLRERFLPPPREW